MVLNINLVPMARFGFRLKQDGATAYMKLFRRLRDPTKNKKPIKHMLFSKNCGGEAIFLYRAAWAKGHSRQHPYRQHAKYVDRESYGQMRCACELVLHGARLVGCARWKQAVDAQYCGTPYTSLHANRNMLSGPDTHFLNFGQAALPRI